MDLMGFDSVRLTRASAWMLVLLCFATAHVAAQELRRGAIVQDSTEHGAYWYYRPHGRIREVLVLAHGTPDATERAIDSARKFTERWKRFADEQSVLLVAPAFDDRNFGAREGPGGGYRGLFGRHVGADAFVLAIVARVSAESPDLDSEFLLYGHSAGGQFACRFALTHPARVRAVVLSAPGRFAFPDERAPWPYGLGRVQRQLRWTKPETVRAVRVEPNVQTWVRATSQPIFVIVGSDDLERQPIRPGHEGAGTTRVSFARAWTSAMADLARRSGARSQVELEIVPGVGHSSRRLTPAAERKLTRVLKASTR